MALYVKPPTLLEKSAKQPLSSEQTREYFKNEGKTFARGAENELARLKKLYATPATGAGSTGGATGGQGSTGGTGATGGAGSGTAGYSGNAGTPTGKSIYEMYGMPAGSQPTDIYSMYGATAPTYTAPNTGEYDSILKEQLNPAARQEDIRAELAKQEASIRGAYGLERERLKQQTENERKSQLSNLYSVGIVNPASSGVSSIGTASDTVLAERLAATDAAEQAALAQASDVAYGRKSDLSKDRYSTAEKMRADAEQKAKDTYEMDRQKISDSVSMVNNVVNAWKSGQQISKEAKAEAVDKVNYLLDAFGSKAIDGMTDQQINELEQSAGLPSGYIKGKASQSIAKVEKADLKEINGNMYSVTYDASGQPIFKLEIAKPVKPTGSGSGSGGGSSKFPNEFKAWYTQSYGVPPVQGETVSEDTYTQWKDFGGTAGTKAGAQTVKELNTVLQNKQNPSKYTTVQLGKLRAANIDPTDTVKADAYLFPVKAPKSSVVPITIPSSSKSSATSILNR